MIHRAIASDAWNDQVIAAIAKEGTSFFSGTTFQWSPRHADQCFQLADIAEEDVKRTLDGSASGDSILECREKFEQGNLRTPTHRLNTSKCHRNGCKRYPKWPMLVEINEYVVGSVSIMHFGGYINQLPQIQKDFETNEELYHKSL